MGFSAPCSKEKSPVSRSWLLEEDAVRQALRFPGGYLPQRCITFPLPIRYCGFRKLRLPSKSTRYDKALSRRVESRVPAAENKPVTARAFIHFRGPKALLDIIKGRPFGVGFECVGSTATRKEHLITSTKYIGLDVHKESISIAMMNSVGKVVMECVIETKASTILQFKDGLRGDVPVTFEEGTWAAWLYDLLKPRVTEVVVCNPRKAALLKDGCKGDRIDAYKLAELIASVKNVLETPSA